MFGAIHFSPAFAGGKESELGLNRQAIFFFFKRKKSKYIEIAKTHLHKVK